MRQLLLLCFIMMSSSINSMHRSGSSLTAEEMATYTALIFPFVEQRSTYDPHEIGFLLHKYALKIRNNQKLLREESDQYKHVLSLQQTLYIYSFTSARNS